MRKLFASIDIGTNSALLLIASAENGSLTTRPEKIADIGLGRGWSPGKRISKEALGRLEHVLVDFKMTAFRVGARLVTAAGTAVFRESKNGAKSAKNISNLLGIECRILKWEEEAIFTHEGVALFFPGKPISVLDIGGGSTEISCHDNRFSIPIGALTYSETQLMDRSTKAELEARLNSLNPPPEQSALIGVGGTITTLAMMIRGLTKYNAASIEHTSIEIKDVSYWINHLKAIPVTRRTAIPGLSDSRVDILLSGLVILETLLKIWRRKSFEVTTAGLRYGLLKSWLKNHYRMDWKLK